MILICIIDLKIPQGIPIFIRLKRKILHQINFHWTKTLEILFIDQGDLVCHQPCIAPFKQ